MRACARAVCSSKLGFSVENTNLGFSVGYVIRLSLGRRLVNLSPVTQRTNALSQMASSAGPWVVGREFESHVHHENAF